MGEASPLTPMVPPSRWSTAPSSTTRRAIRAPSLPLATVSNSGLIGIQATAGAVAGGFSAFAMGGAIMQVGGDLNITNASFTGNASRGGPGAPGYAGGEGRGGAIDFEGSTLTMSNT